MISTRRTHINDARAPASHFGMVKGRALALYRRCLRKARSLPREGEELRRRSRDLFEQSANVREPARAKQLVEEGERRLELALHNAQLDGSLFEKVEAQGALTGGNQLSANATNSLPSDLVQRPEIEGYSLPAQTERELASHSFPPNPTLTKARARSRRRRQQVAQPSPREHKSQG